MMRTSLGSGFRVRGSGHVPRTHNPQPRTSQGQIAVGFLVIAAFTLLLVRMTINLGQMAQVRTETSNAADAGALAAASWIASGENEAALIAGRMLDLLGMVQAIYIVPFCPGDGAKAYADRLWYSLAVHPDRLGWIPVAGLDAAQGPIQYLQDVADAAMIGAWNVGRREYFTAAVNNMILRYATGDEGYLGDGGVGGNVFGDFPQQIRDAQDAMYNERTSTERVLTWNNGLPLDDPHNLKHIAHFESDYPQEPPRLNMPPCNEYSKATYYQYREAFTDEVPPLPVWPEPIFEFDFIGYGITDTEA